MMAIDNSAESFDAWSELTLFAVLEHDDVNFSPLFGKTNYAGWMSNDKDMSWAVFTHRLDGNFNLWGPAVITNKPANYYGSLGGSGNSGGPKDFQAKDGGGPGILMFSLIVQEV